ncbi:heat shock protein transcriptional repressor HspR [Mycetocola spongiae]|uniref:heat shock protein transcriptional repressor HspR n=1 Tax=Mycetocola spongiae TaxID=2859226 RepID=UPI001CF4CA2C|nr:MerR family transcriptional regulator [Mycetocola spongiae]UCR88338.1 MerR family transcriptional regulator [Mycetocola spongiae]
MDEHSPVFAIAMAAELAGMHPQTLRQYDRIGLVRPTRTAGKSRRYSMRDIAQLKTIARLSAEGVSLEGIARILTLENQVDTLTERVRELEHALASEMLKSPGRRVFAAGTEGDVISLRHGMRAQRRNEMMIWSPGRSPRAAAEEDAPQRTGRLARVQRAIEPGERRGR